MPFTAAHTYITYLYNPCMAVSTPPPPGAPFTVAEDKCYTTEQPMHHWKLRAAQEVYWKGRSIIKNCAITEIYSQLVFNITIVN